MELQEVFGDRLYFELQENGIAEQKIANNGLIELGQRTGHQGGRRPMTAIT